MSKGFKLRTFLTNTLQKLQGKIKSNPLSRDQEAVSMGFPDLSFNFITSFNADIAEREVVTA